MNAIKNLARAIQDGTINSIDSLTLSLTGKSESETLMKKLIQQWIDEQNPDFYPIKLSKEQTTLISNRAKVLREKGTLIWPESMLEEDWEGTHAKLIKINFFTLDLRKRMMVPTNHFKSYFAGRVMQEITTTKYKK